MPQTKQSGFTLIELIVVIVILGILGVTAAPRLLSLGSDARASTLLGLKGALANAVRIVYARAMIEGVEQQSSSTVTINSVDVDLVYGYPQSANLNTSFYGDLTTWMNIDADTYSGDYSGSAEWLLTTDTADDSEITLSATGEGSAIGIVLSDYPNASCGVSYAEPASADDSPAITIYNSGC